MTTPLRIALVTIAAALLIPAGAAATPRPLKGICDDANTLYGNPDLVFREASNLGADVIRIDLNWGGPSGVARSVRPVRPRNPADARYDWSVYDRAVLYAARYHIAVLFSVVSTPRWANGGRPPNVAPRRPQDLRDFAFAAATRYSGSYRLPANGLVLPRVRYWLAWNEPNNPVFLSPQYRGNTIVSARTYAALCNAVVAGVKSTLIRGELVACGATAPRGNNNPHSTRPSVSPIAFLRAFAHAGGRGFDAWAHHPYAAEPTETPSTPPAARTAVTLGNFDRLIGEVTLLYGRIPLWITEYGYQTNPPDDIFGVSYTRQSAYLRQAYAYVSGEPRITIFIWFLLRDEPRLNGWQSGLDTVSGKHKPVWRTFRSLEPSRSP